MMSANQTKTECFHYLLKQYQFCLEKFGFVAKKVLSKSWTIRKKQTQKSTDCSHSETFTTIDVLSLLQSKNFQQNSVISSSSKTQQSRQLLETSILRSQSPMPLAQNYKDDVSLLESETALRKPKIQILTTTFTSCQETSHETNLARNGHSSNASKTTANNQNNMLADDDLPEIVSTSSKTSGYETVN